MGRQQYVVNRAEESPGSEGPTAYLRQHLKERAVGLDTRGTGWAEVLRRFDGDRNDVGVRQGSTPGFLQVPWCSGPSHDEDFYHQCWLLLQDIQSPRYQWLHLEEYPCRPLHFLSMFTCLCCPEITVVASAIALTFVFFMKGLISDGVAWGFDFAATQLAEAAVAAGVEELAIAIPASIAGAGG